MWTSMIMALAAVAACGGPAQSASSAADSTHTRCVENALRQVPPRRTVTLICRDGSQARGEILGFDASQGTVRLLPQGARRPGRADAWFTPADERFEPRALPAADVMRLQWQEGDGSVVVGAILGLLIGGLAGGALGASTVPAPEGFLDFSGLRNTMTGVAIGAAVGLTLGVVMTSGSHRTRAIDCWNGL